MPPGGKLYRFPGRFGENVLPYGRHQCLPYSKDAVRADTFKQQFIARFLSADNRSGLLRYYTGKKYSVKAP